MTATSLQAVPVERIWGRRDLPAGFPTLGEGVPVGEIWFDPPGAAALLVKYLFTAERLSIQVHPDDAAAQASVELTSPTTTSQSGRCASATAP